MFDDRLVNSDVAVGMVAVQLRNYGLKRNILSELSGMSSTTLKRYARASNAKDESTRPPTGSDPTPNWFFERVVREDQGCIALKLYRDYIEANTELVALLKTYESYIALVSEPALKVTHVAFLIRYYTAGIITIETCSKCHQNFIMHSDEYKINCSHCFSHV